MFKSVAWFGIYILGYFDFSIAWLLTPPPPTALRDQWKKERDYKLSAARQAALTNEKTMIETRIRPEDLPSWVYFPDKERAEWMNSILQQLWPNVGNYTRKVIAESVEPAVRTALEDYNLKGFKFEKVSLGQVPPRVTGIKVYDKNTDRNEIIIDTDLIFASDCDIKFSLKGISAKISDFSLKGLVRVVFKPLIADVPLIGGIQVYFLTNPDVDFDLGGIANALDVPGLSDIIRKIVVEQLGAFMVLPNKFTMSLADSVKPKQLKCPDSAGVLRVHLMREMRLDKKDIGVLGMGKSDPYAQLSVGAKTLKTKKINNTVNPEWDFTGDFPIEVVSGQQLTLEIFDHDDPGTDEFLGRATVATGLVANKGEISDMWVNLEDTNTGRALMSLSWLQVSSDASDVASSGPEDQAKCLLHVYLDSCKDLEQRGKMPSPLVEMNVGTDLVQSSWPQQHTLDPAFEQGFVFLVNNPNADDLHIKVIDSLVDSGNSNDLQSKVMDTLRDMKSKRSSILGSLNIRMSDLLKRPGMEFARPQPFSFQDGSRGTITLSLALKALKKPKIKTSPALSKGYNCPDNNQVPSESNIPSSNKQDASSKGFVGAPETDVSPIKSSEEESFNDQLNKTDKQYESSEDVKGLWLDGSPAPAAATVKLTQSPSLDEVMAGTIAPMVKTAQIDADVEDIIAPEPEVAAPCGKVKMSLTYDLPRQELNVTVHEAFGLPGGDLPDPPDPYVKLYILPQRNRKSKRKSDTIKDTVNPVFEESFCYEDVTVQELREQKP